MKKAFKKKKILFLTRLYFPHIGGVETHIKKISEILVSEGHEVAIISEKHDKKLKEFEKKDRLDIYRIPLYSSEKKKKFEIWRWLFKNRNLLRNSDIIHIHDVFFWIIPLIFFLDRKKIFITFHGYEGYPVRSLSRIQKKFASRYCSGSISVGDFIDKWYEIASDAVINGGVDFKIITAKTKKIANKAKKILYIGRLSDDMGAYVYLEALKNLRKKGYKFSLEVCGDGKYRKDFEKIGKINGYVEHIANYIDKADLVLSSSYLSMLEVLIRKKPVFSVYNNPLKKDYLLLSPFIRYISVYSNSNDLEDGLKNNSYAKSRIEAGYEWAKSQSWENVLKTYKKLWNI